MNETFGIFCLFVYWYYELWYTVACCINNSLCMSIYNVHCFTESNLDIVVIASYNNNNFFVTPYFCRSGSRLSTDCTQRGTHPEVV